jgi:hypothetical protein
VPVTVIGRQAEPGCPFPVLQIHGGNNGVSRDEDFQSAMNDLDHAAAARIDGVTEQLAPVVSFAMFPEHFWRNIAPVRSIEKEEPCHGDLPRAVAIRLFIVGGNSGGSQSENNARSRFSLPAHSVPIDCFALQFAQAGVRIAGA